MNTAVQRKRDVAADGLGTRVASIDWTGVAAGLDTSGWAPLGGLLTTNE